MKHKWQNTNCMMLSILWVVIRLVTGSLLYWTQIFISMVQKSHHLTLCWATSQFSVISCHTDLLSVPTFCIGTNLNGCLYRVSISWMCTECYGTFWGDWRLLTIFFLWRNCMMRGCVEYSIVRACVTQHNCILILWLYSSIVWRLYWRSWAMYDHKQMPGNIAVQDIWWLLPPTVSHDNENHVTCLHHMAIQGPAEIVKHFQILVSSFCTRVSWHTRV
jgi:hypothetical protein